LVGRVLISFLRKDCPNTMGRTERKRLNRTRKTLGRHYHPELDKLQGFFKKFAVAVPASHISEKLPAGCPPEGHLVFDLSDMGALYALKAIKGLQARGKQITLVDRQALQPHVEARKLLKRRFIFRQNQQSTTRSLLEKLELAREELHSSARVGVIPVSEVEKLATLAPFAGIALQGAPQTRLYRAPFSRLLQAKRTREKLSDRLGWHWWSRRNNKTLPKEVTKPVGEAWRKLKARRRYAKRKLEPISDQAASIRAIERLEEEGYAVDDQLAQKVRAGSITGNTGRNEAKAQLPGNLTFQVGTFVETPMGTEALPFEWNFEEGRGRASWDRFTEFFQSAKKDHEEATRQAYWRYKAHRASITDKERKQIGMAGLRQISKLLKGGTLPAVTSSRRDGDLRKVWPFMQGHLRDEAAITQVNKALAAHKLPKIDAKRLRGEIDLLEPRSKRWKF